MFELMNSIREVKCNLCGTIIVKNELRITANLGSGNFPRHYHLICFIEEYGAVMKKILKKAVEECIPIPEGDDEDEKQQAPK